MTSRTNQSITIAAVVLLACCTTGLGQDPDAANRNQRSVFGGNDRTVKVYRLKNMGSANAKNVIQSLELSGVRITTDPATSGCLIVNGSDAAHEIVASILRDLDVKDADPMPDTTYFALKNREAEEVAELVSELHSTRRGYMRIAYDESNNLVIIKGDRDAIEEVRELIERVDKPKRAVSLSFYFVQGRIGADPGSGEHNLPIDLQGVARALTNGGMADLSLLAPLRTRVQENAGFSTGGLIESDAHESTRVDVQGVVDQIDESDVVRLTLESVLVQIRGEESKEIFRVETRLSIPRGEFVVLASAPSKNGENDALALIVRAEFATD
jgi:type II/III secretion system protein